METTDYETLKGIAPKVAEYLLPQIEQAVEVCVRSYLDDEFNDKWTFGTQFWKNTWNRFEALASFDDCPFEVFGKGNEYKLRIGNFVLRHHRIDSKTRIPKAAKAVKSAATYTHQIRIFHDLWDDTTDKDNIVIAIDADVENGLREVFIGELRPHSLEAKKFRWAKKEPIYLADGIEPSGAEFVQLEEEHGVGQVVPEEEIPDVSVGLDNSKTSQKTVGSDGDK